MKTHSFKNEQPGFALMEILIAIVVFAIGMLALAQLQGALTRSSAEANARTVAHNFIEEIIEDRRGFGLMGSDGSGMPAYLDIADTTYTVTRGGIAFSVTEEVTDYFYDRANHSTVDDFDTTNELDKFYSDMKVLTVTIAWGSDATPDFVIDESNSISAADIGSGEISVSTIIKSATSQASALVLTQESNNQITPLNPYSPGQRPDVIALALGDDRFKESLTPVPEVISRDELVETNFDVITYNQTGSDSIFLRQESFKSVTCECALGDGDGSLTGDGRRPTVWAADEYEEGEWVTKTVGVSDNNNQSYTCDICCRDHHDSALGGDEDSDDEGRYQYDPWRPAADYNGDGDHNHYGYNNQGDLVLATAVGDHYEESCRMVRVDGYWRVIHDFRQEGLVLFPWDFFNYDSNVSNYSTYVTSAAADLVQAIGENTEYYYNSTLDTLPPATDYLTGLDALPTETDLPTWQLSDSQQIRARGIYVDFMSAELREVLDCLESISDDAEPDVSYCSKGGAGLGSENTIELDAIGSANYLEAIPFFDVQLTFLSRWFEDPLNVPVETTNEAVANNNAHSRGLASITGPAGDSIVEAVVHRGNIGFTDTDPIDLRYDAQLSDQYGTDLLAQTQLTVHVDPDNPPTPPPGTVQVSGTITSGVGGIQASKVDIVDTNNASCQRTSTGYTCLLTGTNNPSITFTGYYKNNTDTVLCSDNMTEQFNNENARLPRTIFALDSLADGTAIADIVITEATSCPTS